MKKTTLYIEDDLVLKLKEKTARTPGASMTKIINDALRKYFDGPGGPERNYKYMKKALGKSSVFKKVKDPVAYQKKIRSDWD